MKKGLALIALFAILFVSCGSGGSITVSSTSVAADATFTVEYSVSQDDANSGAWVSTFPVNADNSEYGDYEYCSEKSGSVELYAPSDAGEYEVRLLNGDDETLQSVALTVQ